MKGGEKGGLWSLKRCSGGRGGELPLSERLIFVGTGMTGRPGHRTIQMKHRVAPCAHPSRTLLYVYFNRSGSEGALSFPGATWDRFRCMVEPSPGHIRCRKIS